MKGNKILLYALIAITVLLVSCSKERQQLVIDGTLGDSIFLKPVNSVYGYHFVIMGDFNGDGKQENLEEHYYSIAGKKESNKFYENVRADYEIWDSVMYKKPYSFALSDNKSIDTLRLSKEAQLFGLAYLKNEGDLNGDGTDEVSYVIDYADMSGMNRYYIVTYKDSRWQELYFFMINEAQLPELPMVKSNSSVGKDTTEQRLERELKAFPGLVKKLGKNKVEVIYRNEEAEEDTLVVTLKKLK